MAFFRKRDGFTVLELLTVIAIIGVLAALIFPVASTARKKAKETQCINNIMNVYTAVKQFQLDERRYPDFIAGPVQADGGGNPLPLEKTTGILNGRSVSIFPEYISSVSGLTCPSADNNRPGTEYTTSTAVPDPLGRTMPDAAGQPQPVSLYAYSSYDYQDPQGGSGGETHYSLVRMDMTQNGALNDPDATRQLRWRNPPSDTVVTWCSYHRGARADASSKDIVLFLDGHTARVQSTEMADWTGSQPGKGWRIPVQN